MKRAIFLLLIVPFFSSAESMYSPTWGFSIDLPEGYVYAEGDLRDRFSFEGPSNANFDLIVYNGRYNSIEDLAGDINRKLGNRGETDFFRYRGKEAAIINLSFNDSGGWGLCLELDKGAKLAALAYGPASVKELALFHISALDSIAPSFADKRYPGPVTEYAYPRGNTKKAALANTELSAVIHENDAEAAQYLVEREFQLLAQYMESDIWKEAWIRYYRFIYRDSRGRIADAAQTLAKNFNGGMKAGISADEANRDLAQKALSYVQNFDYERHQDGSDFVNLVSAVTDGRGDCDSRAMLWAIILSSADIRAAIMVSDRYSHAMGLADLSGSGARFEALDTKWLVAETTAHVDIGLIAQDVSDIDSWLGVVFE
ncbi:MAG: hypothetical protein LBB81_10365 [Treponema sp.]|jgi:hypothetical protein|nr:hypothetical protein [Treponema sp.]